MRNCNYFAEIRRKRDFRCVKRTKVNEKLRKKLMNSLEIENLALDRCSLDYFHLLCRLATLGHPLKPFSGNFPS